jgi:DNA-binding CsgD family transcriptional regulator
MSIYSVDFPLLTHVQRNTLRMVAQGLSNSEIARINFVSEKAVEQMVGRIAHSFNITQASNRNMRVLLTLAFLTGSDEVVV